MQLVTKIEVNLNIDNINSIYASDYDQMILNQANFIYKGRCRNDFFIKSIKSIIKRSLPNIHSRDLNHCRPQINAILEVEIIKYDMYDIVVGAKIVNIIKKNKISNAEMIVCVADHARIIIKPHESLNFLTEGQIIPIVVGATRNVIGKTEILISAYPFIPVLKDEIIYKIDKLSSNDIKYMGQYLLPKIQDVETDKENIISQSEDAALKWKYFNELLYPYNSHPKTLNGEEVSLIDFETSGFVTITNTLDISKCTMLKVTTPHIYTDDEAINVYEHFLINYIKYIDVVNKLTLQYLDQNVFDEHKNIFKIYNDSKYQINT